MPRSKPPIEPRVRVLVVDDQLIVRTGLRVMLESCGSIEVVADACDGRAAVQLVESLTPDVVVMDARLAAGDGISVISKISAAPETSSRVVVLTNVEAADCVVDCVRAGANGFILKRSSADRIVDAVHSAHRGEFPLDPAITTKVLATYVLPAASADAHRPPLDNLSEREEQIVVLLAHGLSTAEVACRLCLSQTTVKAHISHILTKWGLRDRVQLVARAYETGFMHSGRILN